MEKQIEILQKEIGERLVIFEWNLGTLGTQGWELGNIYFRISLCSCSILYRTYCSNNITNKSDQPYLFITLFYINITQVEKKNFAVMI